MALDEYRGCGTARDPHRVGSVQPLYLRKGKSGMGALGDWGTFPISRPPPRADVRREILRRMSQENLEIVRREYSAFAARDWTTLAEIWHPKIEYEALDPATYRGRDELREGFMGWSDLYAEWWVKCEKITEAGDQVVALERFGGRGIKGSRAGGSLEQSVGRLITFRDGKIWRVKEYPTFEAALAAADASH